MPSFHYTAIDRSGKHVTGELVVRNKMEAYRELEGKSLTPVAVRPKEEASATRSARRDAPGAQPYRPVRFRKQELVIFTEELADLLDAGMTLEKSLKVLSGRQTNQSIHDVADRLRMDIREGTRFSKALSQASPSFDDLYCSLVAAGEASGSLAEILRRLVVNLKQLHSLQRRTISAMIYPATVFFALVVLLFVFSTVMMPSLSEMMQKTGQELTLVTDLLIRFTQFMSAWWWLLLLVAGAAFFAFRLAIHTTPGRRWWDGYKMHLPAFGPVILGRFYAQFCHTMSNLLNNGVPLLNSLKLITRGTTNHFVKGHLESVVSRVGEGAALAGAMARTKAFPEALIDRVAIGEQTGELGKAFAKAAKKYDEDLDVRISRLTTIVPTVMLVLVAIIVGIVAYCMITTLFGSMAGIGGRRPA